MGKVLQAAIYGGLIAGLVVGVFHSVLTEPVIDQAIALEELADASTSDGVAHETAAEEPMVARDVQRIGLVLGFVIYGLSVGLLLYGAFFATQRMLPNLSLAKQGMLLSAIGYWSIALVPFLKYPANPPGVGEPESVQFRQLISIGLMALTLLGAALSLYLARRRSGGIPWQGLVTANLVYAGLLIIILPVNPDPVNMPLDLVFQFRALSLTGLTLFWGSFAAFFARFLRGDGATAPTLQEAPRGAV